jgi:hypothetical protein
LPQEIQGIRITLKKLPWAATTKLLPKPLERETCFRHAIKRDLGTALVLTGRLSREVLEDMPRSLMFMRDSRASLLAWTLEGKQNLERTVADGMKM